MASRAQRQLVGLVKAALEALRWASTSMAPTATQLLSHSPPAAGDPLRAPSRPCLPRESRSKEVDSACLSVIGYPAGPVEDPCWSNAPGTRSAGAPAAGTANKRFPSRWPPDGGGRTTIASTTSANRTGPVRSNRVRWRCLAYELVTALLRSAWEEAWGWRRRLEALSWKWTACRSFPSSNLVPQERSRRTAPAAARPRSPMHRPLSLEPKSLTWLGICLLNGLIKPKDHRCPLAVATRRSRAAEQVLVVAGTANASIRRSTGSGRACRERRRRVTEDDWAGGAAGAAAAPGNLAARHGRGGANAKLGPQRPRLCAWRPWAIRRSTRQRRPDRLPAASGGKPLLPSSMTPNSSVTRDR